MFKICFYAPLPQTDAIKQAMFDKGAGKIGPYSCCAWQTLGEGQFLPETGSNPFLGTINQVEKVAEYKVEMVCEDAFLNDVIMALKATHPYEQPAYQVYRLENI